ncbi:MAG: hypothetical protein NTV31_12710 [Bacteroidia bacterium]|nr:hypothetical protein [Bacteroidia bacterium]
MKTQKLILILTFLLLTFKSSSQGIQITQPKLEFDGSQFLISYDVIDKNQADEFYVWVEIVKKNGESIKMKALSGDVGTIKTGINKKITWIPEKDSIFLNEEIFVEVLAEKYIKSFNKGSMMLMSTVIPGLGQTKISKGKPWWLTGVAAYGALSGGYILYKSSLKTHDSYKAEKDIIQRADLADKYQKQVNISNALFISAASLWVANIVWVTVTPNRYKPLQHVKLSLDPSIDPNKGTTLLTLRLDF